MKCPKCKADLFCPCKNCVDKNLSFGRILWVWKEGDIISCPVCNYEDHVDNWEE